MLLSQLYLVAIPSVQTRLPLSANTLPSLAAGSGIVMASE